MDGSPYDLPEEPQPEPWGLVPVAGRGSLPFALVHGESLIAAASWALTTAGAELFDFDTGLAELVESGRPLVLHDPLCPLTPADFITAAIEASAASDAVVVGVRPVTDTIKEYDGHVVGATIDRESLLQVVSPIVLPAAVLASLDELVVDFAELVSTLMKTQPVTFLPAPAQARRIVDESDLPLLEAIPAEAS